MAVKQKDYKKAIPISIPKYEEKSETHSPDFFLCSKCGKKILNIKNLVASQSELYAGLNYRLPICRNCMNDLYKFYLNKYSDMYADAEERALRRICMLYDMYYSKKIYDGALSKVNAGASLINSYVRMCNLNQYRGKTYDTTLDEERERENFIESSDAQEVKDSEVIDENTVDFFGPGLGDVEDYEFLKRQYDDWITRHECNTKSQEEIFKRIVIKQLEIRNVAKNGGDTKDLDASFIKYLDTAKLQPKQNAAETTAASQTLGTLIEKWETTRPIPEIDEELQDVDKIGLYLDVFFRGHLAKMMGLKKGLSNLYSKFIKKFTVTKPEYDEDEDEEVLFDAIFGNADLTETVTKDDDDESDE